MTTGDIPCPNCGVSYSNISRHWLSNPDCDYPEYSETQHALVRGILLTHGSIETGAANPSLRVSSRREAVLEWLDAQFGVFSRGVHMAMTAEEVRESLESRDDWSVTGETSPMYEWGLRTHPALQRYASRWYESDTETGERERRVPPHVERHPSTLLAWYLFAGRIARGDEKPHVVFPFTSMNADLATVLTLLEPFNPRVYSDSKAPDVEKRQDIHLRDTQAFFKYIGTAPREEFASKWPRSSDELMADDTEGATCPSCGRQYTYLSAHWDGDPDCDFPVLSERQRGLLTALLLSGATLNQTGETKRPHLLVDSTNRAFLDWASNVLGLLCAHVTHRTDAEATRERFQEWLGRDTDTTRDVYRLQTRSHPFFEDALSWADRKGTPERTLALPADINRTPALYESLYLHRGTLTFYTDRHRPVIRTKRMAIADDALLDLFEPFDPRFAKLTTDHRVLVIGNDVGFFDYVGGPPPGLEDLWPEDRR